jgi:hypothetical protein
MQRIDLVYVLGSGSVWKNNEIRMSLRSVEKNLSGVGKVYVIGEDPGFLSDKVIYIYHPDPLGSINADGNMTLKIIRACHEKSLSDNFLFMNDDFIINLPARVQDIPWMHKIDMKDRPAKFWNDNHYRKRLKRTFDVLKDKGYPTIQYDYHAPMIFNKHEFPKVMEMFDYKADIGYTFRSLYGNVMQLPAIPISGHKVTIYDHYNFASITKKVADIDFVGYNDKGLNNSLKWWIIDRFPEKSKFELTPADDMIFDLYNWKLNGMDYELGVALFERYYRHKNLVRLFKMGQSNRLQIKLEYKLSQTIKEL